MTLNGEPYTSPAPRIRLYPNQPKNESHVGEAELAQVILALRLFMPWAGLSLSTRERAGFRDEFIGLGRATALQGFYAGRLRAAAH